MSGAGVQEAIAGLEMSRGAAHLPLPDRPPPRYPDDVEPTWRTPLILAGLGATCVIVSRSLVFPAHAEGGWTSAASLALSGMVSGATSLLPFSVIEVLLVAYVGWLAIAGMRALRSTIAGRRRWRNMLAGGGRRVLRDVSAILVVFYTLWGFNYARPPFAAQAGWPALDDASTMELVALGQASLDAVNRAYVVLHGSDDVGTPTTVADPRALDAALDTGWREATRLLALHDGAATARGRMKFPLVSGGIARLGIAGMYVPFTGEAHAIRGVPAIGMTMTMAHEKAHQRGIAREGDANFLGFAAASLAPDPLARYAAAMFAHRQLMAALPFEARDARLRLVAERLPGVQRDLSALRAFWTRQSGPLAELGSAVNDRFLSAQGIPGGAADYRRSVWLIVAHARHHEGRLGPGF